MINLFYWTTTILLASMIGVQAGPVGAVLGGVVASAVGGSAIVGGLVKAAIGIAISFASKALFGKSQPSTTPASSTAAATRSETRLRMAKEPANPTTIIYGEVKTSGTIALQDVTDENGTNRTLHMVVLFAAHECNNISEVYFNQDLLTGVEFGTAQNGKTPNTGNYAKNASNSSTAAVKIWLRKGIAGQTSISNLYDNTNATSDYTFPGYTYAYMRLLYDDEIFTTGLPTVFAKIEGKKLYDPRTTLTVYSTNPVLAIRDYLTDTEYGVGIPTSEIDDTSFISAANSSDTILSTGDKRFTCNGVLTTDNNHQSNIEALLSSCAGKLFYANGKFRIKVGVYSSPTVTLTEADLLGPIAVQTSRPIRETFNSVKGVFIDPTQDYQPTDFPPLENSTYITQDGGTKRFADVALPFTNDAQLARRIAKITLLESRQALSATINCGLSAYQVQPGDTVQITNAQLGWSAKTFEVQEVVVDMTNGIQVQLQIRETASTIYDWSSSDEEVQASLVNTNMVSHTSSAQPTDLTADSGTDELEINSDGTIISRIKLSWTTPAGAATQRVEWKKTADTAWQSTVISKTASQFHISPAQDGVEYQIRVYGTSSLGGDSTPAELTHVVIGKTEKPQAPTGFLLEVQNDGTRQFQWTPPTNTPDLAGYEIRYSATLTDTWNSMTKLKDGLITETNYETNLPAAGTWIFELRSKDTSENYSEAGQIIIAGIGEPRTGNVLTTVTAPTWSGTITNGWEDTDRDVVVAEDNDTWADLSTWAAWTTWHQDAKDVTYEHAVIDLGAKIGYTPLLSSSHTGTATYEIATSDDNVTYSAWATADGTGVQSRYIKCRVTVSGDSPEIANFVINISADTIDENIEDLDTSTISSPAGDFRVPLNKTYNVIKSVQIALQNVGSGWTWEIIDKNAVSGPRIKIYNSSGTLADATVDIYVRGV